MWPKWYDPISYKPRESLGVINAVCQYYGITKQQLIGSNRERAMVNARIVAIKALRERGLSYPRIGQMLGGRDHSTVIHNLHNYEAWSRVHPDMKIAYLKASAA